MHPQRVTMGGEAKNGLEQRDVVEFLEECYATGGSAGRRARALSYAATRLTEACDEEFKENANIWDQLQQATAKVRCGERPGTSTNLHTFWIF